MIHSFQDEIVNLVQNENNLHLISKTNLQIVRVFTVYFYPNRFKGHLL